MIASLLWGSFLASALLLGAGVLAWIFTGSTWPIVAAVGFAAVVYGSIVVAVKRSSRATR